MSEFSSTDSRRVARMLALQALCQFDALGEGFERQLDAFLRDIDDECLPVSAATARRAAAGDARELALGAWRQREECDRRLAAVSPDWRVERMTTVDRNTLRSALFELLHRPQTPFRVVMNEAIELARTFGDGDSPAFVNGVLDAAWRAIESEMRAEIGAESAPAEAKGGASDEALEAHQAADPCPPA